jgi:hypothetical protein
MKTTKQRQASFKKRMRDAGYVQVTVWVPKDKKAELKAFAEGLKHE